MLVGAVAAGMSAQPLAPNGSRLRRGRRFPLLLFCFVFYFYEWLWEENADGSTILQPFIKSERKQTAV